jgi:hypothetical protein
MVRIIYPRDWEQLRLDCLRSASYQCEHCGIKDGMILESKRSGRPYIVYLHAAHAYNDIDNPTPSLTALCASCHIRHDRQQATGNRRSGYGKFITTENLAQAIQQSGLLIWVENDGLHWKINQHEGTADDPPQAVTDAISSLAAQNPSAQH